jgi:ribosomal protein S18 acetylase RimI-like enzyme
MQAIRFEPLHAQEVSTFSCGESSLDAYLKTQAGQDIRRGFATVIVAVHASTPNIVLGYYSLSAASIDLTLLPENIRRKMPRYGQAPAALLGRLATDASVHGRGLGSLLLADALLRAYKSELAWTVFLVRAKNDHAAAFYRHFGFSSFGHEPLYMWLTRQEIQKLPGTVQ